MQRFLFLLLFLPICLSGQDFFWHKTTFGFQANAGFAQVSQNGFSRVIQHRGGSSFSLGPRLQLPISKHFFLRTGLSLSKREFNFQTNTFEGFQRDILFPSPMPIDIIIIDDFFFPLLPPISVSSNLTTADVPLILGYMIPKEKVNFYITTGFITHIFLAERSTEQDLNQDPSLASSFTRRVSGVDMSNSNISLHLGAGIAFKLNSFTQLFVETDSFMNLGFVQLAETISTNYSGIGLNTGLSFTLY